MLRSLIFLLTFLFSLPAFAQSQVTILSGTGSPLIDQIIASEQQNLARAFGAPADVLIYDDRASPNAFATARSPRRPQIAAVFLGRSLLLQTGQNPRQSRAALIALLAHEWAHVLQYRLGMDQHVPLAFRQSAVRSNAFLERHADFMTGWYMQQRLKGDDRTRLSALFSSNATLRRHHGHGSAIERILAANAGAKSRARTALQASDAAQRYVRQTLK